MRFRAFAIFLSLAASAASAWENHTQLTDLALGGESWAGREVTAETLVSFLEAEKSGIAQVLAATEKSAAADYTTYLPLPASLVFDPSLGGEELRASFIGAIRVNPEVPFSLFLQVPAGRERGGRPDLGESAADSAGNRLPNPPFAALEPGEAVTALEVVETAADEPDYGMDIGLFENNGSEWGARYGFGVQPFGNPALSYGSQAPFHMSFANESGVIKMAAPKYQRSYVGYRVDLYAALARAAFASGHDYWGCRFAGWALHYVQDATQPYHSSMLPAKSTLGILVLNAFGSEAKIDGEVVLLSNRHLILENYQYAAFAEVAVDEWAPSLAAAIKGEGKKAILPGDPTRQRWVLDVVAKRARVRGRALDAAIVRTFPAAYVADPAFDFGAWQSSTDYAWNPRSALVAEDPRKVASFDAVAASSLAETGAASRAFVGAILRGPGE